jgi:hypothetical protein
MEMGWTLANEECDVNKMVAPFPNPKRVANKARRRDINSRRVAEPG